MPVALGDPESGLGFPVELEYYLRLRRSLRQGVHELKRVVGWLLGSLAIAWAFVLPASAGAATVTFNYTGAAQDWVVPYGVTSASWDIYGAEGMGYDVVASRFRGGDGGRALATISVTGGSTVRVMVGGKGGINSGGFNGGGNAQWGGGGATDIRIGGTALTDRVLVAGGGGAGNANCVGASDSAFGGTGTGGPNGWDGTFTGCGTTPGTGGTQSAGGSINGALGLGGAGIRSGGGGGYYGGGGSNDGTGGGGSGFGPPGYTWSSGARDGDGIATVTYEVTDTRNLYASATGPGDGYVSTSPAGIDCGIDGAPGHDDCTEAFGRNQPVTVTANPSPGSEFDQWIGPGPCSGNTNPTCQVVMDQPNPATAKIVSARFKVAPSLELSASGPGDGSVSSSPAGIDCGTTASHVTCDSFFGTGQQVTLTANPDQGSLFNDWGGDCSGTQPTCTLTLSEDRSVTASFVHGPRTLAVAKSGNGSGLITSDPSGVNCGPTCEANFPYGTEVTLTPTAAAGSDFTGWSGACSGTGTCTVQMDQIRNVEATFTLQKRTLTLAKFENGSGSVVSSPAGINYPAGATSCLTDGSCVSAQFDYGTQVTLTPTAADGSTFTDWGGACDAVAADQNCVLTMDQNRTAETDFVLQTRALEVEKTGSGTGEVTSTPTGIDCGNDCTDEYEFGTEVTLTANPGLHSVFAGWSGPCSGTGTCAVTMDQIREVTAQFSLEKRTLDVTKSGNGSGTVASLPAGVLCGDTCEGIEFDYGTEVELAANPDPLSEFTGWTGACSGSSPTCTVALDQARTVEATFSLQKRSLAVTTSGTGSGTVTTDPPGQSFDVGSTVTLEAVPAEGSTFTGWSGDCSGTVPTCTIEMSEARSVDASFTADPVPPDPAPVIGQLMVAPRKVALSGRKKSAIRRRGPIIGVQVSESATVRFTLVRKPGKARNFKRALRSGVSMVRIPAALRKKLKPGRYQLTAVATDKKGQESRPRRTGFRIIR